MLQNNCVTGLARQQSSQWVENQKGILQKRGNMVILLGKSIIISCEGHGVIWDATGKECKRINK